MKMVWHLIALLFLVMANGQEYDNGEPELTSPTRINPRFERRKEYLLYLTPDQVQTLQSLGAIVRPLPQLENIFFQQRYQPSFEGNHENVEKPDQSNYERKQGKGLPEIYKVLNRQQINESLSIQSQSTENPIDKLRTKYKYTSKPRQPEYASLYVPKRNNKTKSHSTRTEYIRYLPSYEAEILKIKPYHAQPLPGYNFKDLEVNSELKTYEFSIRKEKIPTPIEMPKLKEISTQIPNETHQQEEVEKSIKIHQPEQDPKLSVTPISSSSVIRRPEKIEPIIQVPTYTIPIGRLLKQQPITSKVKSSTEKIETVSFSERDSDAVVKDQEANNNQNTLQTQILLTGEQEKVTVIPSTQPLYISPSTVNQMQYSPLLAPLLQHEKISDSTAQKEELVNSERAIQITLKEIKESGNYDEAKYISELSKLKKNLEKQNILAQRLAFQNISKTPQGFVKEEFASKRLHPLSTAHIPGTLQLITPRPYPVPWGIPTPISSPNFQPEKVVFEQPASSGDEKAFLIPGTKSPYTRTNTPYFVHKIVPGNIKQGIQLAYTPSLPTEQPDNLIVIRPIWEH